MTALHTNHVLLHLVITRSSEGHDPLHT